MSKLIQLMLTEMEQEAETTRKMLSIVPADKFDWKPHVKSMSLRQLSTHVAELPSWITMTLTTDELDFSTSPYSPEKIGATSDLLAYFERSFKSGFEHLKNADENEFDKLWTLRDGDTILSRTTRYEMLRMTFSQIVHHRAQLGVFLRLLDIPIPGSYGPSADDSNFQL